MTQWKPGQLQEEVDAGAWLVLDCDADLARDACRVTCDELAARATPRALAQVIKDRVSGWQPGKPKPLWTELLRALGDDFQPVLQLIYAD